MEFSKRYIKDNIRDNLGRFEKLKPIILGNDIIFQNAFRRIIDITNPTSLVETGTYLGWTTEFFALEFPNIPIYTCETNKLYFKKAKKRLSNYKNVFVYNLSSPIFLKDLVNNNLLGDRPLFFLDAHWENECPLKKELKIISNLNKTILVIHDFKVPNKQYFQFDSYNKQDLDINLLRVNLSEKNKYSIFFPNYPPTLIKKYLVGYVLVFQNIPKYFNKISKDNLFIKKFKQEKI